MENCLHRPLLNKREREIYHANEHKKLSLSHNLHSNSALIQAEPNRHNFKLKNIQYFYFLEGKICVQTTLGRRRRQFDSHEKFHTETMNSMISPISCLIFFVGVLVPTNINPSQLTTKTVVLSLLLTYHNIPSFFSIYTHQTHALLFTKKISFIAF